MRATYNTQGMPHARTNGGPRSAVLGTLVLVWLVRGVGGVAERGGAARVCSDHQIAPCLVSVGGEGMVEVPADARSCMQAGCCWGRHPSAVERRDHEEMCLSAPLSISMSMEGQGQRSSPLPPSTSPRDHTPSPAPVASSTPSRQQTIAIALPQRSEGFSGVLNGSELEERERAIEPYLMALYDLEPMPIPNSITLPSRDSLPDSIKHITLTPPTQAEEAHRRSLSAERQLAVPWCPPYSGASAYYAFDVGCGLSPALSQYYAFPYLSWVNMLIAKYTCQSSYYQWPGFSTALNAWGSNSAVYYSETLSEPMTISTKYSNCTIDIPYIYYYLNSSRPSITYAQVWFYGYNWNGNLTYQTSTYAYTYSLGAVGGFTELAALKMCTTETCTNQTEQLLIMHMVLGETTPRPTAAPTQPTVSPTHFPTALNKYKLTDVAINRGNVAPRGFFLSGLSYIYGNAYYDSCNWGWGYPLSLPFPITFMGRRYDYIYFYSTGYISLGGYVNANDFNQYAGYSSFPVIYLVGLQNMLFCKLGYKTDYSTYFLLTAKGYYYMYPDAYYQLEVMFSNSNVTGTPRSLMEVRVFNLMSTPSVSGVTNGTSQWVKGRRQYFDYATTTPTEVPTLAPTATPTTATRRDLQDATGSPTPSRVTFDDAYTMSNLGILRNGNYSSFVIDVTTAVPIFYPEAYLDDDLVTDVIGTLFPTMTPTTARPTTTPTLAPTGRPTTAPTRRPTSVNAFALTDTPLLLFGDMAPRTSTSLTWQYVAGGASWDTQTYYISAYAIPLSAPVTVMGETYSVAYVSSQGMIQFGGYCQTYENCYWSPWGTSPYLSLYVMAFDANGICNIKYATDGSSYTIISVKGYNANLGGCTEGNSYRYDVVFSNSMVNGQPRGLVEVRLGPNMGTSGYYPTTGLSNGSWVQATRVGYDYLDTIPTKAPTTGTARRELETGNSTDSTETPTEAPTPTPTLSPTRGKVLYSSPYTLSSLELVSDGGYTNYVLDVTIKSVVYYPGAYLNDSYSGETIGTKFPTTAPTFQPSQQPTAPTIAPTALPTLTPTGVPSASPTRVPTTFPTSLPTTTPTTRPTETPTLVPTTLPTTPPTTMPSTLPTTLPSTLPTTLPTTAPTRHPYPMLKSLAVVATTSTSITATLSATKAGYAWCLALASASVTSDPLGVTVKASGQGYSVLGGEDVRTNVTMTGLIALTDYSVYCYTEDTSNPANKLFDSLVAAWKQTATTRCCYRLTTPSLPSSLYVGTASSALTLTSPVSGSIGPTVTIIYRYYSPSDAAATCNTSAFENAIPSMWNDSQALLSVSPARTLSFATRTSQAFTLYTTIGGCYQITYNITGVPRANWFYPPSVAFFVLDSDSTPLAPVLSAALFSDSGAQVFISFGSDTDQAGLTGSWSCASLFTFVRSSEATCAWVNYTTVLATLSSTATLVPGDSVELIAQKVRPRCTARKAYKCLTWPYATASTVTVAKPLNALLPTPSLVFASTISGCDSLIVDASASKGSGGRNMWYIWSVQSPSGADVSNITTYLDSINGITTSSTQYGLSKLVLTKDLLTAPTTYSLVLSLYNFLGYSMDSKSAVVSVVSDFIPMVKIMGPPVRTTFRTAALSLFAQASISECSSAKTLSYAWWLVGPTSTFSSTSSDPRAFRLAANSLSAGATYNVSVTVTDNLGQASNASTQVVVIRSPLVAIINGGVGDRTVGKSTLLSMDGSASYDPDEPTAALTYNWTCIRGGKNYGKPCGLSFDPSAQVTSVAANTASVGVYLWTLSAFDLATARSATSTAAISVQADTPPRIAISGITAPKVNPSAKLAVVASVADDSGNFTANWGLTSGSLKDGASLVSVTRTPLVKWASEAEEVFSFSFPLVILAGSLSPKTSYVFTLSSVNNQGISGFSVLSFSTTGPPTSGYLRVSPTSGVALVDEFSLWSDNWTDDEDAFPLSYGFSYSDGSGDGVEYVITSEQSSNSYSPVYLPLGKGINNTLQLITLVTNLYDATARATVTIAVTRPTETLSELKGNVSDLLSSALEAFDSDKMLSVIGAMAGLMATEDDDPDLRSNMLAFVANASALQDASLTSVNQQACLVAKLVPDSPGNLTTAALDTALSLIGSMSANSEEIGISTSTASALGSTVSSLLSLVPSSPQNLTGNESADHSVRSALSASVSAIALAGTVSLTAGEDPFLISSPNLNVSSDVSNPDETRGKTLGPPGTTSGLALPSDGLGAIYDTDGLESVAMSVVAMPNLYAASSTQNVSSGVVRFSLLGLESGSRRRRRLALRPEYTRRLAEHAEGGRRLSSSGSLTPFYMTLDTQPQNYTIELESFNMSCAKNEVAVKNHTCSITGEVYYLQCSGKKGMRNYTCGAKTASLCSIWTGARWDSSACEIIELTSTQVRCACYNASQLLEGGDNSTSDSARRRLYGNWQEGEEGDGQGSHRDLRQKRRPKSRVPDDGVSSAGAEFGAVIESVGVGIAATFAVARTLNASVLSKNFVVFLTMGLVLLGAALLGYWAHRKDLADKRKAAQEDQEEHETDKAAARANSSSDGASEAAAGEEKRMRWLIQQSLPTFARVRNYWNLLVSVLKNKHDWASIVFVYDKNQPRLVRVVIMTTALITIMFANAALNAQVNPDPAICDGFVDAEGCLAGKSQVDPSATQCLWDSDSQVCSFNEAAAGSLFAVIVVAVLSTMFAVPPLMFVDYLGSKILIANLKGAKRVTDTAHAKGPEEAGSGSGSEPHDNKALNTSRSSRAAKVLVLSPHDERQEDDASIEDISVTVSGRRPGDSEGLDASACLGTLSQRLSPSNLRALHASMRETMNKALTARQTRKEEKRLRDEAQNREVKEETRKALAVVQLQRAQLLCAIDLTEVEVRDQMVDQARNRKKRLWVRGKAVTVEQRRLRQLQAFRAQFERKWQLNFDGSFRTLAWWEVWLLGRVPVTVAMERRIKHELKTVDKMEEELEHLEGDARELQLLEYSRLDFLNHTERKVYLKNKVEIDDGEELAPVSACVYYLSWAFIVLYNMGLAFYVCLFGVQHGASVTNAWLVAFVIGLLQDILVYGPAILIFFETILPLFVRYKIKEELDAGRSDPIVFVDQIPPGPATRVALRHPDWLASKIIAATNTPKEAAHAGIASSPLSAGSSPISRPGSPGLASPRMLGGLKASVYSPRANANMRVFGQEMESFFLREVKAKNRWVMRILAYVFLSAFLTLPGGLQEFLVEQMVPVVTGLLVVGFDALHKLANGAIAGPILFFFLCVSLVVLAFSERLRRQTYRWLLYLCCCGATPREEPTSVPVQPQPQGLSKEQAVGPSTSTQAPSGAGSGRGHYVPPPLPLLELPAGRFARTQARKAMGDEDKPTPQDENSSASRQRQAKATGSPPGRNKSPPPRVTLSLLGAGGGEAPAHN